MSVHTQALQPELPDFLAILAGKFKDNLIFKYLYLWEHVVYSLIIVFLVLVFSYFVFRRPKAIPGRLQNLGEVIFGGIDDFVCGILGQKGRKFTPFIGTLFIYILFMNLFGIIPFLKPSTASWSTTIALALCVFVYVQYSAIKELGVLGYFDHLAGKPRGILAFSVVLPLLLFVLHIISELFKPISLSLRLRSVIWGDDILLAVLASFGLKGIPLLFFNMLTGLLTAVVQALVFCILSTVYFAVYLVDEE